MNRLAAFVTAHRLAATVAALAVILGIAAAIGWTVQQRQEREQLSLLQVEAARRGVEIMSQTLNGNVMGSMALFGLIDEDAKREARGDGGVNRGRLAAAFETAGRAFGADGVFLVDESGTVQTSWDSSGKSSTGTDVRFRPYYQIALKGRENVYAAVSIARGDRSLYFTAPVYESYGGSRAIGGIVARTSLEQVDALLHGKQDLALLLSPQGVVFAGNNNEWIGYLSGAPAPERIKAIRELKQFGNMFESREPRMLPFAIGGGISHFSGRRYAVAETPIRWNDPAGEWRLVLMQDLAHAAPLARSGRIALLAAAILSIMSYLVFKVLRKHQAQLTANERLEAFRKAQQEAAERKSRLAGASLRLHQTDDMVSLARAFLAATHDMFGVLQGTVYASAAADADVMRLLASYGCDGSEPKTLRAGEGLLGQCVVERQTRVMTQPGAGYWKIRSGLGSADPDTVLMLPVLLNQKAIGAVELALLHRPGEQDIEQLEELTALFAVNLEIQRRHWSTLEETI
jgi:two-component system C4-dicarboxylate transport sensor histidine kinase DctB